MKKRNGGFTLVELLVVLVILGLLGGLVIPKLIGTAERAKVKAAKAQIQALSMAVERYYIDTGSIPDNLTDLISESGGTDGWSGPYTKTSSIKDPWGVPYQFSSPGQHGDFDILSYGPDKSQGGESDINSWD